MPNMRSLMKAWNNWLNALSTKFSPQILGAKFHKCQTDGTPHMPTIVAVRVDDPTAIQGGDSTVIQVRFIHVNRP